MTDLACPDPTTESFESALDQLQRIVSDLEEGSIGLEESLQRFEKGMTLLRRCQQILAAAEQRVEIVVGRTGDGGLATSPFDASASLSEAPPSGGRPESDRPDSGKRGGGRRVRAHDEPDSGLF